MNTIAIYPGTFDPITNGHLDLIKRAASMFDQVIVGVAASPTKSPMFTLMQRVDMAQQVVSDFENVVAEGFSGLLIDFAKVKQARLLIRGLRTTMDFEYELGLTYMYKQLIPDLESVFLPPSSEFAFLSSTMVREVAIHGGSVQRFVPDCVNTYIEDKFVQKHL